MVGLGMLMIATGVIAIVLYFKKRLFDTRWFQYWCMALTPAGFVADISLHTEAELETLLGRVEQLLERPRKSGEAPLVSLVLHGPEVEFFALKNYPQYRGVVDHAAKLAALGAVDISICQTQMRTRGIGEDEVPGFLRQVPYGPQEVQRLLDSGYVYM